MPDTTPTIIGGSNRTYPVLRVVVAHDHAEAAAVNRTRRYADIADAASPLAGHVAGSAGPASATVASTVLSP